jgi:cytochrome c556
MSNFDAWSRRRDRAVTRLSPRAAVTSAVALLALSLFPQTGVAQSAPRPEQFIKWRQSVYQVVAWNTARIKTALAGNYDAREVQAAANALAALAAAGLPGLFPVGTEKGQGWRETSARAAVFADAEKFHQHSEEFARESGLLAKLAAGQDQKAVREQFLKVAATCKGCHDQFRQTD